MSAEKQQSLLERILDGAIELVKKPFVVKRITRAFDSAHDSLEEQILGKQAQQNTVREDLVKAAKSEGNLTSYVQSLINLQVDLTTLEAAKKALEAEKQDFLG